MKIKELLDKPEKWTTGSYARDYNRWSVVSSSPEATCYCLAGAMRKCYPLYEERLQVSRKLIDAITAIPKMHFSCIESYNDYPDRTFDEIKQLVETLDV